MEKIAIYWTALMFTEVEADSIEEVRTNWRELVKQDERYNSLDILGEDAHGDDIPVLALDHVEPN